MRPPPAPGPLRFRRCAAGDPGRAADMAKVLVWPAQFWPAIGGVETVTQALLPALRDRGHVPVVITSKNGLDLPDEDTFEGIPVYRFSFHEALRAGNLEEIAALCRRVVALKQELQPDLVHFHFSDARAFFQLRTAPAYPAPLLITLHNHVPHSGTSAGTLVGRVLASATWVAGVSRTVIDRAIAVAPEIADRAQVVHNGLSPPALEPTPLPTDPATVVCMARLIPDKGVDVLLDAFAAIVTDVPGTRLIVAGDGPLRAALAEQAAALGVADSVMLPGWVGPDDIHALLNSATVVVVPSRWQEPFPTVAIEAGLMARPVVASRVGGIPELVLDELTGILVEPDDPGALAGAIVRLLRAPDAATQMGRMGRKR